MRYEIQLNITYDYSNPSDHARVLLRLLPTNGPHQTVIKHLLTISPTPDERRESFDFFGNAVCSVAWHSPIQNTSFTLLAAVERGAPSDEDCSTPLNDLGNTLVFCGIDPTSPQHFRHPSPRIASNTEIRDYAKVATSSVTSTREAIRLLGEQLYEDFVFDSAATEVSTPPEVAFAARRGVCQDFAQIMICGLREIGIPAAYVSGYLRTTPPPGEERLEGVDAMHAWVAAWCGPEQGWVEYDPTNKQWAGDDYIAAAIGRDYSDVAPVKGALRTTGSQDGRHTVDVVPLE
ncbi:transglutaminase family protein [Thioclava sp. FR2]|uniref:transglutaminase family protein n=1 Tax=Thioclava sp. FR2 TaxID=3445780 RepID=UPI003EC0D058